MNQKIISIIFPILLTITLFSLWAGFALLVVNKLFYKDLPGYTIGKICIWEVLALFIAAAITKLLIVKWGNEEIRIFENKKLLMMNSIYGLYIGIYFLIATVVGIWQFWLFSQNF